jgi:protein-S-isoprenylcysteine O-methyltransferase Ste14
MPFPKRYAEIAHKLRVPLGFVVAGSYLVLARPSWWSLAWGMGVALIGLAIRAWAAGHLAKNQLLTTSGPYTHLRNPLYVGSLVMAAGFALAGRHAAVGVVLAVYFVFFLLPVVEEEERHLRKLFPGYEVYARRVPKFWPRLRGGGEAGRRFEFSLYLKNREYEALGAGCIAAAVLIWKIWMGLV